MDNRRVSWSKGIDQIKRNMFFSNAAEICAAVERFVDEFDRVPTWEAELRRCAVFVEIQCMQGSGFWRAMDTALEQHRSDPKKAVESGMSRPELTVRRLREEDLQGIGDEIWLADQVVQARQTVGRAIAEGIFSATADPHYPTVRPRMSQNPE